LKRLIIQFLILTTTAIPVSARTQPVLYLGSGVGIPLSPGIFQSKSTPGPVFTMGAGLRFNQAFELASMIEYHSFRVRPEANIGSGTISVTELGFEGKLFLAERPHRLAPYLMAGVTLAEGISSGAKTYSYGQETGNNFMAGSIGAIYTIGMGLDLTFSPRIGVYTDIRARFTSLINDINNEIFSFAPIRAGLKIHLGK
jgi:hypothetical protein